MNKEIVTYILLTITISFYIMCSACKQVDEKEEPTQDTKFQPTGELSDLVYNPVRPDGSIDSSFLPILEFEEIQHDFGTIYEGDIVEKEFHFTNRGTAPLLIQNVNSSCGCTIPFWPEEPVAPGESGTIRVKFDSKNREGHQKKEVTIFANTYPNRSQIVIEGNVVKTK